MVESTTSGVKRPGFNDCSATYQLCDLGKLFALCVSVFLFQNEVIVISLSKAHDDDLMTWYWQVLRGWSLACGKCVLNKQLVK